MASPFPAQSAAIAIGADRLGWTDARAFNGNPRPSLPEERQRLLGIYETALRTLK